MRYSVYQFIPNNLFYLVYNGNPKLISRPFTSVTALHRYAYHATKTILESSGLTQFTHLCDFDTFDQFKSDFPEYFI